MSGQYSSRTADKFVVRLPNGMRERIAAAAEDSRRSMNSEIVNRIEQTLIEDMLKDHPSKTFEVNSEGNLSVSDTIGPWIPQQGMLVSKRDDSSQVYMLDGFMVHDDKPAASLDVIMGTPIPFLPFSELKPYIAS